MSELDEAMAEHYAELGAEDGQRTSNLPSRKAVVKAIEQDSNDLRDMAWGCLAGVESGRLFDREAIDWEAAAHAIRDRRCKLNHFGEFLYDEDELFRVALDAAIGATK